MTSDDTTTSGNRTTSGNQTSGKLIAWSYFDLLSQDRFDDAAALLLDGGTWWTCSARTPRTMREHKKLFPKALEMVPMRFTLQRAIEEGDVVVLEVESRATLPDGELYNNVYSFVMTMWDGRILHAREYSDTASVAASAPAMMAAFNGPVDED